MDTITYTHNKKFQYNRFADIKRLNFIFKALKNNLPKNGTVLDVGCGNGIISMNLGLQGFNVQGIDVSEKAIEKATKNNTLSNVKFDVTSAEELVANNVKYDAIICSEVLEHLDNPSALVQVLYQSLADNGRLIVTVPNGKGPRELLITKPILKMRKSNGWLWKIVLLTKKIFGYQGSTVQSDAENLDHVQFFTRNDLQVLSSRNYFAITKFEKSNFVDDVFPFSIFSNKFKFLQKIDCKIADILPYHFTGGFMTIWEKSN